MLIEYIFAMVSGISLGWMLLTSEHQRKEPDNGLSSRKGFLVYAIRGESRATATSKVECFVIIVNNFQPLIIITKHSILDVAAALDPPFSMLP